MKLLLVLIGPGIGLGLALGADPEAVLRYAGALLSFGMAHDMAICQTCAFKLPT